MTSIKRAGRITTFGFAVGTGLLIASGASAAVAAAAPADSGHPSTVSSPASGGTSPSARSARPATGTTAKSKPARTVSARSEYSAPVIQLHTKRPAAAISAAPTASARTAAPKRVPALPTPDQALRTITDGLGTVRRNLDDLREKIETLVQNQITGFQNSLLDLRIDLQRLFSNKPLVYGNPANSQFWMAQGIETSYLMAAAMVITRLTGEAVTADSIVDEAMATNSTVQPGRKMYLGPSVFDFVWPQDAFQLMENHGVKVTTTFYNANQGRQAFSGIESALAEGKSVIVTINGPISSVFYPNIAQSMAHPVVLLGIDITNNVVYLNDGTLPQSGQKMTMSIDAFIDNWRGSNYSATVAELAPVTTQTVSPATEAIAA